MWRNAKFIRLGRGLVGMALCGRMAASLRRVLTFLQGDMVWALALSEGVLI